MLITNWKVEIINQIFYDPSTYKTDLDLQPLGIGYFANKKSIQRNNYIISICLVLMQTNKRITIVLYKKKIWLNNTKKIKLPKSFLG